MNGKLIEKCGGACYDPETECCSGGKPASKQACSGGSVGINGPADLIIAKIPANSPRISLQVTFSCPCPDKITWSSSSDKIKFVGATNQTTVQLIAAIESQAEGDITINVNVAGSSAQKNLTVRRPVLLSHPVL